MIVIDGSQGEGGGQILRSALSLSLCTGLPFRIERIRAGRNKPGLMRQHLTALQSAIEIGGADASGAALGSTEVSFSPGAVRPGAYRFAVGTAGSANLVLQTILPALITASAGSELVLEGGTHNPFAPPFEFIAHAFCPLVARMGPRIELALERPGFHPAGGGRMRVTIDPVPSLNPFELTRRGALIAGRAEALIAGIDARIGTRELDVLGQALGWAATTLHLRVLDADFGPGNALIATLEFASTNEVIGAIGTRGVPAERVAGELASRIRGFLESAAAVGPHLADQLLLPMALAGAGAFTTVEPSDHLRTNARVIEAFLPRRISIEPGVAGDYLVTIR